MEAKAFKKAFQQKHQKNDAQHEPKMVPKLSKINPGGALEASWEPALQHGASKTSFLTILAPFWDPLWDHFGLMLGVILLMFFP